MSDLVTAIATFEKTVLLNHPDNYPDEWAEWDWPRRQRLLRKRARKAAAQMSQKPRTQFLLYARHAITCCRLVGRLKTSNTRKVLHFHDRCAMRHRKNYQRLLMAEVAGFKAPPRGYAHAPGFDLTAAGNQ